MSEDNSQRTPVSEIDLTFLTTDPAWGKNQVPEEYVKQLIHNKEIVLAKINEDGSIELLQDEKGKPMTMNDFEKHWARLGFLIKDIRLGNISKFGSGADYCEYYLNLAGDCLEAGLPNSHITSLQRPAVKLEVSQSVGGFLRKRTNTITSENISNELDPQKKNFFGGKREK